MELLESDWFFRMVEHRGRTPDAKLAAVFTVTGEWISAPGIKEGFVGRQAVPAGSRLRTYLIETAQSARASDPAALVTQLLILLQGAIAEELRDPHAKALQNAAAASRAVIARACRQHGRKRVAQWSAAASLTLAFAAGLLWQMLPHAPSDGRNTVTAMQDKPYLRTAVPLPSGINPSEMEAVLALQEKFNLGICPAPHLLALPQGQATAYMNVIQFRTPDDPDADRANLHAFLVWFNQSRASECYYAPSNGHTLVNWR
jgi:hypothetical protein